MFKLLILAIFLVAEISAQSWSFDNCSNSCLFSFGENSIEMFWPETGPGACQDISDLFGTGLTPLSVRVFECNDTEIEFAFYSNSDCNGSSCYNTSQPWTELYGDGNQCDTPTNQVSVDCHLYTPTPTPVTPTPVETPTPIFDTPTPIVDTPTPVVDTPTPVETPTPVDTPTPTPTTTPTPTPVPTPSPADPCVADCVEAFDGLQDAWVPFTHFKTKCDNYGTYRECLQGCSGSEADLAGVVESCKNLAEVGELCDCDGNGAPAITGDRLIQILQAHADALKNELDNGVGGIVSSEDAQFSGNGFSVVFVYESTVSTIEGILEDIQNFLASFLNQDASVFDFGNKKREVSEQTTYTLSVTANPGGSSGAASVSFSFVIFLILVLFQLF